MSRFELDISSARSSTIQSENTTTQTERSHLLKRGSAKALCRQRLWSTTLVSLIAAMTSLIGGYTLGYSSPSLLDLRNMTDSRSINNGSILEDIYGAISPVGALFGGAVAGWSADILGRKPTLIITTLPYFVGWSLLGISWYINRRLIFVVLILAGRFLTGFGTGWALLCGPVYIGEVSIPSLRGLFSSLPQLLLNVGILLVYCFGSIPGVHFHVTAFVASGLSVVLLLVVIWVPETPRFLVAKGKIKKAERQLFFLRGSKDRVEQELTDLEEAIAKQRKLAVSAVLRELTHRDVYLPFVLMLFVMLFQQFSGINSLVFYGASILQDAGFGKNSNFVALLTVGLTAVVFTFVSALIVDYFGRKKLLMSSAIVMCVTAYCLGLVNRYKNLNALAIVSVIGFEIGFSVGYGAIPWVMIAEMIPLSVRGFLGGVLAAINWSCAALIGGFYLEYARNVGADYAWWTFAAINALSVAFVAFFLPETKGKKLEDIKQQMLQYKLCSA